MGKGGRDLIGLVDRQELIRAAEVENDRTIDLWRGVESIGDARAVLRHEHVWIRSRADFVGQSATEAEAR